MVWPCYEAVAASGFSMAVGACNARPPPVTTPSLLILDIQVPAGGADDAELPVFHQPYRDALEVRAHAPLVEEALHELALHQEITHAGDNAAGEVDAALGAV